MTTPDLTPPADTRQQAAEAFKPWEGDHTDLVHVLWAVDRDGLTLHDNFDEVASRIRSSRWLRAYTAAALASSSPALPEPPAPKPGRWWRVLSVDGDLWCETSDEAEAREKLAELEGPGSLWRLYVTRSETWREVAAADVTEETCTGAHDCTAGVHIHGCFADTDGPCDDPAEHRADVAVEQQP